MAKYEFPDGRVLNVRDDVSPDDWQWLVGHVKKQYDVDISETNALGQAFETLRGIPRGAVNLATDAVLGPASLFDIGNDSDFVQGLQQFKDYVNTQSDLSADPAYRDKWLTKLGEGLGSYAPFLGAAKVGKLMRARGVGAPGSFLKDPMFLTPAALAVPSGISQQADRVNAARALGEDVGGLSETFAEVLGGGIGLSEIFPVLRIFQRTHKNALQYPSIRNKVKSMLKSGLQEGTQETMASLAQDAVALGLYSDELPFGDSLFEEFTIGGAVGALADLFVNSFSGRTVNRARFANREKQSRKNRISFQEDRKFQMAQEQGQLEEVQVATDDPLSRARPLPVRILDYPAPELAIVKGTDQKFSVIDLLNEEVSALKEFDTLAEASVFKNKQETDYERAKHKVEMDNAAYALGLPNSSTAYIVGQTIRDPNDASIQLQSIVNADSKLTKEQKARYKKEKHDAGFRPARKGEQATYNEMVDRKKQEHLTEITKYVEGKGLPLKAAYTMPEVRQILNQKDYNILLKDLTDTILQESEKSDEPAPGRNENGDLNVTAENIKRVAASKNIDLVFKDPAVQYAASQWTGYKDIAKARSRPAKELFLARLHSLPAFNQRTRFPDFRPRKYIAQDIADFVAMAGSENIEFSLRTLMEKGVTAGDSNASEQFKNDLVTSGRAIKVEGTNKFRIRPNHHIDIARRAEGFNESPEEFGERLRKENELNSEDIDALVEKERKKQSKVLPPEDITNKIINFQEAVEKGRTNVFVEKLKKTLDRAGLSETGIIIGNDILSTKNLTLVDGQIKFDPERTREGAFEAEYDRETDIIFLSLNAVNPDGNASEDQISERLASALDREIIHALREKDLINEKEYQYLRGQVKTRKVPESFDSNFKGRTFYQRSVQMNRDESDKEFLAKGKEGKEEHYVEAAIAEMYRARTHKPDIISPKSDGIFSKIVQFFKSMGTAMRASGFKRVSDIFNDIETGAVGARTRGEIRTLRELDRLPPDRQPQEGDDEEAVPPTIDEIIKEGVEEVSVDEGKITISTPRTPKRQDFSDVVSDTDPITGRILVPSPPAEGAETGPVPKTGRGPKTGPGSKTGRGPTGINEHADGIIHPQRQGLVDKFGYEVHNSSAVLDYLIENSPSKDYKFLFKKLKTQINRIKKKGKNAFTFQIVGDLNALPVGVREDIDSWDGRTSTDFYVSERSELNDGEGATSKIYINDISDGNGVNYNTVLHEFVHQATTIALSVGKFDALNGRRTKEAEFWNSLEKIRRKLKTEIVNRKLTRHGRGHSASKLKDDLDYAVKNNYELLAVGLSTHGVQYFMESIPYVSRGRTGTLWSRFVDSMRKLLNLDARQGTLLSEFLLQAGKVTGIRGSGENQVPSGYREMAIQLDATKDQNLIERLEGIRARGKAFRYDSPYQREIDEQISDIEGRLAQQKALQRQEGHIERVWMDTQAQISMLEAEKDKLEKEYKRLGDEAKEGAPVQIELFARGSRFADDKNTSENIKLINSVEKAEESVKQTPRGQIPYYNINSSDVALDAALNFNEDASAKPPPEEIPDYSRGALPKELREPILRTGYAPSKAKSLGATLLDVINDPIENISAAFKRIRQGYIDNLSTLDRSILDGKNKDWYLGIDKNTGKRRINPRTRIKGQPDSGRPYTEKEAYDASEKVRLYNNSATTSSVANMRLSDRARGIFRGMLLQGKVTSKILGEDSITLTRPLEIEAKYNPFLNPEKEDVLDEQSGEVIKKAGRFYGGWVQMSAPLFSDPSVDLEAVFGLYSKIMRVTTMQDNGRIVDSPVTEKDRAYLELISKKYPAVVEVYNNYQKWNNALIEFAKDKGLLSEEQAKIWQDHSSYYPFYRTMVSEEGMIAPTIGGGSLPDNPMNIKMEGSKREIDVNPLEAIARNSLSILSASMKNDGVNKMLRDLSTMGEARFVTKKEMEERGNNINTIFAFVDGEKLYYELDDVELYNSLQALGVYKVEGLTKLINWSSRLLRDSVTRDPGFMVVNLIRDTQSAAITSGLPLGGEGFTPVIDTFKAMFEDISALEKFGVIGGYDFSNDEGSVVQLMSRARRQHGLTPDNSMTAEDAFFKVWDGLGAGSTKSDGATRWATYNAVYNTLKKKGASEAEAQSESAYQALEIINFGRRGSSPTFRLMTAAIPFLNASVQGLDVFYRAASGKYSAIDKLEEGETEAQLKSKIMRKMALRSSALAAITAMYYILMSDTDEYKAVKREVRDDNWILPNPLLPGVPIKIPIGFEVGMLLKAIPERIIDWAVGAAGGESVEQDASSSIFRQLGTLGGKQGWIPFQLVKPLAEVALNWNSFSNTEIVPYYKLKEKPAYQSRQSTNEVARLMGELIDVSPIKIEHVFRGYTGSLGGYALDITDVLARMITGTPIMPPNINDIPVVKRLFFDLDKSGGLQQQFYELREIVSGAVITMNDLREQGRLDEYTAYREHSKGIFGVKSQVNAINRYMSDWRKRRDLVIRRTDISAMEKSDIIRQLELDRDRRLAIVPALRRQANVDLHTFAN